MFVFIYFEHNRTRRCLHLGHGNWHERATAPEGALSTLDGAQTATRALVARARASEERSRNVVLR